MASTQATAKPMNRLFRVPDQIWLHKSWPMVLVPNQNSEPGARSLAREVLMTGFPFSSSTGWRVKRFTSACSV